MHFIILWYPNKVDLKTDCSIIQLHKINKKQCIKNTVKSIELKYLYSLSLGMELRAFFPTWLHC